MASSSELPYIDSILRGPLNPAEFNLAYSDLWRGFRSIYDKPPADSPELRLFGQVAMSRMEYAPTYPKQFPEDLGIFTRFLNYRQEKDGSLKAHLFRIAAQHMLQMQDSEAYLQRSKTTQGWHDQFDDIFTDPHKLWIFEDLIETSEQQANDPKRYAGVKIAIVAHPDIILDEEDSADGLIDCADGGTAAGLGPIQVGDNLPFVNIRARDDDNRVRALFHMGLKKELHIGTNIGFDKVSAFNPPWVKSCVTSPHHFKETHTSRRLEALYEGLYKERREFKVQYGNVAQGEAGIVDVRAKLPRGVANVASGLTTFYEIAEEDQDDAIDTLASLSDRLLIIQEPARIDPHNPERLIIPRDNIYGEPYRLFTKDLTKPNQPFNHLLTWSSFNCGSAKLEPYLIERLKRYSHSF